MYSNGIPSKRKHDQALCRHILVGAHGSRGNYRILKVVNQLRDMVKSAQVSTSACLPFCVFYSFPCAQTFKYDNFLATLCAAPHTTLPAITMFIPSSLILCKSLLQTVGLIRLRHKCLSSARWLSAKKPEDALNVQQLFMILFYHWYEAPQVDSQKLEHLVEVLHHHHTHQALG